MASGMFGGHESFQGEFILVTVAFHINSSFAGKVQFFTNLPFSLGTIEILIYNLILNH